jgi:hypothetical protein
MHPHHQYYPDVDAQVLSCIAEQRGATYAALRTSFRTDVRCYTFLSRDVATIPGVADERETAALERGAHYLLNRRRRPADRRLKVLFEITLSANWQRQRENSNDALIETQWIYGAGGKHHKMHRAAQ